MIDYQLSVMRIDLQNRKTVLKLSQYFPGTLSGFFVLLPHGCLAMLLIVKADNTYVTGNAGRAIWLKQA